MLGSRPKMGGGAFGKPSLGVRGSQASKQPAVMTSSAEKEGPAAADVSRNSRYHEAQQSVESVPKAPEPAVVQEQKQPETQP